MTRVPFVLVALALALIAGAPAAAPAATSSSTVVVGELYPGGGNAGATYANDYVELFNRSAATVDVTGWTLQYASSASTTWEATPLTGTIAPGGHYLVALASGGTVGAALPAADATGTTNLAASGGKIALVSAATSLACGATAGSCSAVASVRDLVGYGTATDFEGAAAAPAGSSTNALARGSGGCVDTNDNAADFATAAPTPKNAIAAPTACGATGGGTGNSATVSVTIDVQPVIAVALDRSALAFGNVVAGTTPAPAAVAATVSSNDAAGYTLGVHRSAFTPTDLPLAIVPRAGVALTAIPVAPAADLQIASTTAPSAAAGDAWPTSVGFLTALPVAVSGHYAATVTYTVLAR
jgi:predicted extracellular nuclease